MTIEVDLQSERTPGGHPDIAQPQFFIEEIEIIVQALPLLWPQIGLACLLVVPGFIGGTTLHGRENPHQAGALSPPLQHRLDLVFFANIPLADEIDLQAVIPCEALSVLPQPIPQRFSKARIVEDTDVVSIQIRRHSVRIAETWKSALDQNPVVTGKHTGNLLGMPLGQQSHGHPPALWCAGIIDKLSNTCNPATSLVPAMPG